MGRLSPLEDDSTKLIPAPSRTVSPSTSATSLSRDQPVLSLAQVSVAICLLGLQSLEILLTALQSEQAG